MSVAARAEWVHRLPRKARAVSYACGCAALLLLAVLGRHEVVNRYNLSMDAAGTHSDGQRRLDAGWVEWSMQILEDDARQVAASGDHVFLTMSDFEAGTYRIKRAGVYTLAEDIEFNPLPDNNCFPPYNSTQHPVHSGYFLGFFAAITVEADGVVIDLAGHTIKQSGVHYLMQRFFAVIELASRPFIANVGPPQFKNIDEPITFGTRVIIENGTLGLSSHHGVHGNRNSKVFFKNLIIKDFEVGGISLNGAEEVLVENVDIGPSVGALSAPTDVPLATLSQARFVDHMFTDVLLQNENLSKLAENTTLTLNGAGNRTVKEIVDRLRQGTKAFIQNALQADGARLDPIANLTSSESSALGSEVSCPNTGLWAHGRCWYLSELGETCSETCTGQGLGFSWTKAHPGEAMVPQLLGETPTIQQSPWARLECYNPEDDRYHLASNPSQAVGYGDVGDPMDFSHPACRLACPCTSQRKDTAWRVAGQGICLPSGINLGRTTDWLGEQGCKSACDDTSACNVVTYNSSSGHCNMSSVASMPSCRFGADMDIRTHWKPLDLPRYNYQDLTVQYGLGMCVDEVGAQFDAWYGSSFEYNSCEGVCSAFEECVGFEYVAKVGHCRVLFGNGKVPQHNPLQFERRTVWGKGVGPIAKAVFGRSNGRRGRCYQRVLKNDTLLAAALAVFHNEHNLPDGSAVYGILFHKTAPAIHDFGSCTTAEKENIAGATERRIVIRNVHIHQLKVRTDNVIMANSPDDVGIRGPAGDVVQLLRASSYEEGSSTLQGVHYRGTLLSDAQLALQTLKNIAHANSDLDESTLFEYFGAVAIPNEILAWASDGLGSLQRIFCKTHRECVQSLFQEATRRGVSIRDLMKLEFNGMPWFKAARQLARNHFKLSCGLDAMAHANKGAVGARFEFVDGVSISGLRVDNIENVAPAAHPICRGMPADDVNVDEPYLGADSRGIVITVSKNIELGSGIEIDGIRSINGRAFGIDIREATLGMQVEASVQNVTGRSGSMEMALGADKYASGKYTLHKVSHDVQS